MLACGKFGLISAPRRPQTVQVRIAVGGTGVVAKLNRENQKALAIPSTVFCRGDSICWICPMTIATA